MTRMPSTGQSTPRSSGSVRAMTTATARNSAETTPQYHALARRHPLGPARARLIDQFLGN